MTRDPPMRPPQPPIPKPAKLPPLPESRIRPGCEILAISAGADAGRLALRPCRKVAWFCYAPLADFYSAVDIYRHAHKEMVRQMALMDAFGYLRTAKKKLDLGTFLNIK